VQSRRRDWRCAIELLADDLLDTTEAEIFRSRDGAHRLSAHEAGEDPLRALMLLGQEWDGLCSRRGHAVPFDQTASITWILLIGKYLSRKFGRLTKWPHPR
jgi:hypothetical protein